MENKTRKNGKSPTKSGASSNPEGATDVGDVDVSMPVPASVQSLITQVDRNSPPPKPKGPVPHRSNTGGSTLDVSTEYRAVNSKPAPRRSVFSRFFCCASKDSTAAVSSPGLRTYSTESSTSAPLSFPAPGATAASKGGATTKSSPTGAKETSQPPQRKKLLALDLDETLVHSSFQPVDNASFVIAVTIEGVVHHVYVIKRPGCDEFLQRLAEHYELIIYTASLSKYADPLMDILDLHKVVSKRLFRENCVFYDGHYVKDLSLLNREITQTIIVDNSPMSYIFHPENAIDCSSFFDDMADVELWQIADFLISIKSCADVRTKCRHWREWCKKHPSKIPSQQQQQEQNVAEQI